MRVKTVTQVAISKINNNKDKTWACILKGDTELQVTVNGKLEERAVKEEFDIDETPSSEAN